MSRICFNFDQPKILSSGNGLSMNPGNVFSLTTNHVITLTDWSFDFKKIGQ